MFKFSIRELFLLTLVVGLALGWWIDRARLRHSYEARHEADQEIISAMSGELMAFGIVATWSESDAIFTHFGSKKLGIEPFRRSVVVRGQNSL